MSTFAKIIPIGTCPSFGDGLIDTVNARDLHRGLESKRQFTNWLDQRLEACGFKEDEDYVVFNGGVKNPLGGRPTRECFLSLDAAKHFAMLEKNDMGKSVRQYFIEHEKQAKLILPANMQAQIGQAVALALGPTMAKWEQALEVMAPKALVFDKIASSQKESVVQFARKLEGVNLHQVQADLVELGILYRHGQGFRVVSRFRGSHFTEKVSSENPAYMIIRPTAKGMELLARLHDQGKLTLTKSYEKTMKKVA